MNKRYSYITVESALIIQEAMTDMDYALTKEGKPLPWESYRDQRGGAYAMRQTCLELAVQLDKAWKAMGAQLRDGVAFDWEFSPHWLSLIQWRENGYSLPNHSDLKAWLATYNTWNKAQP